MVDAFLLISYFLFLIDLWTLSSSLPLKSPSYLLLYASHLININSLNHLKYYYPHYRDGEIKA